MQGKAKITTRLFRNPFIRYALWWRAREKSQFRRLSKGVVLVPEPSLLEGGTTRWFVHKPGVPLSVFEDFPQAMQYADADEKLQVASPWACAGPQTYTISDREGYELFRVKSLGPVSWIVTPPLLLLDYEFTTLEAALREVVRVLRLEDYLVLWPEIFSWVK